MWTEQSTGIGAGSARVVALLLCALFLLQGCAAAVVGGVAVGASAIHDRRATEQVVADSAINLKVTDAIHRSNGPGKDSHIKNTTYNGTVLLTGEALTAEVREEVETITQGVEGVKNVVNALAVGEPTSAFTRSRDSLLTAQVKSSLLGVRGLEDFDPTRVKVVSVRHEVYLMGLVTEEEGEAAAQRAARVSGVDKVVKVFEYIETP
ncbi:MAG: BON domain-containing protein [Pseudomonadota bacterium]